MEISLVFGLWDPEIDLWFMNHEKESQNLNSNSVESKKILERCISINILKFQNMGPIYCKIVKNELFTIAFKDVGFFVGIIWKNVGCNKKLWLSDLIWLILGCLRLFPERYNRLWMGGNSSWLDNIR